MPQLILHPILAMLRDAVYVLTSAKHGKIYINKGGALVYVFNETGMVIGVGSAKSYKPEDVKSYMASLAANGDLPHNGEMEVSRVIPNKPIAAIDFDSVLYSNTSGWKNVETLPDPPSPMGLQTVSLLRKLGFKIVIVSVRIGRPGGLDAIKEWLKRHNVECHDYSFSLTTPPASIYLSKNAMPYNGFPPAEAVLAAIKANFDKAKEDKVPGRGIL